MSIYRNGEGPTEGNEEAFGEVALALEYRGDRLKLETILDYSDRELRRGDGIFVLSGNATAAPSAPDLGNAIQQPWEKVQSKSPPVACSKRSMPSAGTGPRMRPMAPGATKTIM